MKFAHVPRAALITLVTLYQKTLSPDHGPLQTLFPHGYCPQHPTCSEYAKQMLRKNGAFMGSVQATWRVIRCTPWTKPTDEKLQMLAQKALHNRE